MAKEITLQDCEELYAKFKKYTETAEQHEFPVLVMIHMRLKKTLTKLRLVGEVEDQKDARAMFRVVLKTIGSDASEYEEDKV
jgi:hypothetical protein